MVRVRFDQPGVQQFLAEHGDQFMNRFCSVIEQLASKLDGRPLEEVFVTAMREDALVPNDPATGKPMVAQIKSVSTALVIELRLPAWGLLVTLRRGASPTERWTLDDVSGTPRI